MKATGIGIYWWNLIVSVLGMVYEAESVLVSFQHHTGVPWVAVIQENPMKIFSHRVKMGALWSYYC